MTRSLSVGPIFLKPLARLNEVTRFLKRLLRDFRKLYWFLKRMYRFSRWLYRCLKKFSWKIAMVFEKVLKGVWWLERLLRRLYRLLKRFSVCLKRFDRFFKKVVHVFEKVVHVLKSSGSWRGCIGSIASSTCGGNGWFVLWLYRLLKISRCLKMFYRFF